MIDTGRYSPNRYNASRYNVNGVQEPQAKFGGRKSPSPFFDWSKVIVEPDEPLETLSNTLALTEISYTKTSHTLGLTDNSFLRGSDQLEITNLPKLLHDTHDLTITTPAVIADIATVALDVVNILAELKKRGYL